MGRCANVFYYWVAFVVVGVRPADIRDVGDLAAVPFMDKDKLRELQPWGLLGEPAEQVARFHATTGTTGLPCNVAFSRADLDDIAELGARNLTAMGVGPRDVAWQCYGYGLWMGGSSLDRALETVGVTNFPAGPGRTTLAAQRLADLGVTVISCTPTFAVLLAERAHELGLDPVRDWRLRVGILGGETMTVAARARLAEMLPPGFRAHNTYGTTELGGPFVAGTCEHALDQGTFHVWGDHFLVEIIDPDTEALITEPGVVGELVVTTLRRQASPMIRWRTRDLTAWAPDVHACPCGRHARRAPEPEGGLVERLAVAGVVRHAEQVAGVREGPAVVGAAEGTRAPLWRIADEVAAMRAAVEQHVQLAVLATREDDRLPRESLGHVVAGPRHLALVSHGQPLAAPDPGQLLLVDSRARVERAMDPVLEDQLLIARLSHRPAAARPR